MCFSGGRWWPTGMRLLLLAVLFVAALTTGIASDATALRFVRKLHAPSIVDPRSDSLVMRCEYDLQGNELYSVTWYKGDKPLFRYMPSSKTRENVHVGEVSIERSNAEQLTLLGHQDLQENKESYEGTYVCEVTMERSFRTDYAMANVSVAILPQNNPVLEGVQHNYQIGEQLDATCVSAPSLPAANLTFYLNNQKVAASQKSQQTIGEVSVISRLSVSVRLKRHNFPGGSLTLACVARLPGIVVERDYRTEKTATLAASNQRLAQEPPRLSSTSGGTRISEQWLGLWLLVVLIRLGGAAWIV